MNPLAEQLLAEQLPAEQLSLIGLINGGINPSLFGYSNEEIAEVAHLITSEEGQVALVKCNHFLVQQMPDVCEAAQIAVITQSPDYIKYIKNPTNKVQIQAVTGNPSALRWIRNPCKEAQVLTANNIIAKHDARESLKRITDPEAIQILVNRFRVQEVMES
jgi:hypothetical protein